MAHSSSLRGGRTRKFKAEINVVPYIDVMLVLLVIFMVVAPLSTPSMINLPKAGKSNQPPTEYLEIELKPDGSATVGIHGKKTQTTSKREELGMRLQELHDQLLRLEGAIKALRDLSA